MARLTGSGVKHAKIAINDTTATRLTPDGQEAGLAINMQIQNLGEEAVYIGGEDLTSTDYGVSMVPGSTLAIDDLPTSFEVYALSASGDSFVSVIMVRR